MSHDVSRPPSSAQSAQKEDQITHRCFIKTVLLVASARLSGGDDAARKNKVDKWFNIETPDSDLFREHLRIYRTISSSFPPPLSPPTLHLQVVLSVPELNPNQVLVLLDPSSSRFRVDPTPRAILLESWTLSYDPSAEALSPPTIYKHAISLFRSMYTLLRLLPAWKLYKRLRRRGSNAGLVAGGGRGGNGAMTLEVRLGPELDNVLPFDTPLSPTTPAPATSTHTFPPLTTPHGSFTLQVRYLTSTNFQLDSLESLLSSGFLSQDTSSIVFTPTVVSHRQRDSLSSSPGSLPLRPSLARSPPKTAALTDRFSLPPVPVHTRTVSLPSSNAVPLPLPQRQPPFPAISGSGSGSGGSAGFPGSQSGGLGASGGSPRLAAIRAEEPPFATAARGSAPRVRKESFGIQLPPTDRPSPPTSSPLPLPPPRRPSINAIHPFKSSTLSTGSLHSPASSHRQQSPLSAAGVPTLPSRPPITGQPPPPSPTARTSPTTSRPWPLSSSPSSKPSPPFAALAPSKQSPSSLGKVPEVPHPPTKRYSSSFQHRIASASAQPPPETEASPRTSEDRRAHTRTEEEEINEFVQFIDSRIPFRGRGRSAPTSREPSVDGRLGAMFTTQESVDDQLKRMTENFQHSLEGLSERTRRSSRVGEGGNRTGNEGRGGGHTRARREDIGTGSEGSGVTGSTGTGVLGHLEMPSGSSSTAGSGLRNSPGGGRGAS